MATNFNKLLVALFFTAVTSASVAHGILINSTQTNVDQIQAIGCLTCPVLGSNIPGNPIANATVALNCGGVSFNPMKTNLSGLVCLSLDLVDGILFDTCNCTATITLGNAADCPFLLSEFTVAVVLSLLDVIENTVGPVLQCAINSLRPLRPLVNK